ncbi:discoidin domain-containing protein [Aestuariibaculum marinum]|uniref:Discoidin domain-containing protein n=1 Tax=Aestuariibaculum marinum TaxID=2683592 RepID=A0A8J6PVM7_9FLAO|nr:discoidin domain-containing protein [Aestuariibaculum marinum]MBD0823972.1 discoidin domain-containing protein [Aestuariibaculum marinum]
MKNFIKNRKNAVVTFLTGLALVLVSCSLDTVTPDPDKLPSVPLSRAGWEVIDYSSQEDQGGEGDTGRCADILDGNPDTFWHSCWNGCTPVPPHFITVDMQTEQEAKGFFLMQRQSLSRNIETCEIQISSDNSNWESLGVFTLEKVKNQQDLAFESPKTFRYFKFIVKTVFDGTDNAALAELVPYTN